METYSSLSMKKLPKEVRHIMLRSHDETTWTLADLRKQLWHEVETRGKSSLGQSDKEESVPNPPFQFKFPTAGSLFSGALGKENAKNDCTFCDGPHPLDSCKIVPTIDQRLAFLHNQKRCFRCFKKGHMSKSCYSKKRCSQCMENIIWGCADKLELTSINSLEQIQPKKILAREILRKKILPSQKYLHLSA